MDINTRYEICEMIAQKWTDQAHISELKQSFFNQQYEWLNDMPDHELLDVAREQGIGEGQA